MARDLRVTPERIPVVVETDQDLLLRARTAFAEGRFAEISRRHLRRLIDCVWTCSGDGLLAVACVEAISRSGSLRLHRAMVETYLRRFPDKHDHFGDLCRGLHNVAADAGSVWTASAGAWNLFDPVKGPKTVGMALLRYDPAEVLKAAGLVGELASGRFSRAAWRFACRETAESDAASAHERIRALAGVADSLGDLPSEHAQYAWALLKPATRSAPSQALKRFVIGELVGRIGDPRLERARWDGLRREMAADHPEEDAAGLIEKLRLWLVENAVHQFLDIVDLDADPNQWPYRKAFWLSYLKAGYVKDAWVAFGPAAADRARDLDEHSDTAGKLYAALSGGYHPSQSVLLMKIGDIVVGDWSHVGSCRFWTLESNSRTRLFDVNGNWLTSYRAVQLRTLDVHEPVLKQKSAEHAQASRRLSTLPDHEEPHGEARSYNWQRKFNEIIGELTHYEVYFEYDSLSPREHNRAWEPDLNGIRRR